MKVVICSCARCTAAGNEFLYDSANIVKKDLEIAYELENISPLPDIEISYENIMKEVENPEKSAPLAKIDDTYYTKAKPEVLMEHIFNEFTPKKRDRQWKNHT